jgi:hypothetical protein
MHPHIRTGQGTSTKSVWLDNGFWHEPHTAPTTCRTIRVWLRGEDSPRTGYSYAGLWVVYDANGMPVHTDADFVIGWQDIPAVAEAEPTPAHDWPLMAGVAAVVISTLVLALYLPAAGVALACGFGAGVFLARK